MKWYLKIYLPKFILIIHSLNEYIIEKYKGIKRIYLIEIIKWKKYLIQKQIIYEVKYDTRNSENRFDID